MTEWSVFVSVFAAGGVAGFLLALVLRWFALTRDGAYVDAKTWRRLQEEIRNPPQPTEALIQLIRDGQSRLKDGGK